MTRDAREICHLLQAIRDWGKDRPYNALMCLIALHEAGELGLSTRKLAGYIGRGSDCISATLKPWVKAGLIEFETTKHPRRKGSPSFYKITAEGREHAEALFHETITVSP